MFLFLFVLSHYMDNYDKYLLLTIGVLIFLNLMLFGLASTNNLSIIGSIFSKFEVSTVKDYVLSFGILAPVIFILLQILQTVVAPIPGSILVIVGGLIWGTVLGGLLSVIGVFMGAVICFSIARALGRPFVEKFIKRKDLEFADQFFKKYGFPAIIILRLIPFMAFDVISYGAGLSKMDMKKYATATLLGMIPSTFFYSYLGFSFGESNQWIVIVLTVIVLIVFFSMGKFKKMLLK